MGKKLKAVYFQIRTKPNTKNKKAGKTQKDKKKNKQDEQQIRVLDGKEISAIFNTILAKPFENRFAGEGDFVLAGPNDKILAEAGIASIPKDQDGYRFFLFMKRRSDSPTQTRIEDDGSIEIKPIEISNGSFISETTLVVLNEETGVLLQLLRRTVGTSSAFTYYLSQFDGRENPEYYEQCPVLNMEAFKRLGEYSMINKIEFSLSGSQLPDKAETETIDYLYSRVSTLASNPATKQFNVRLSSQKGKSFSIGDTKNLFLDLLHLQNNKPTGICRASGIMENDKFEVVDFVNNDFLFLYNYTMQGKYINTKEVFDLMLKDFSKRKKAIQESIGQAMPSNNPNA